MPDFDMLVLGSGPGGQKAAIAAAKLGRRVAVVDRPDMLGGVSLHTGTIPSKTLREAVLYLTGLTQRDLYGQSYRLKEDITVADLTARTQHVVSRETEVIRSQLSRNHVALYSGTGRFVDEHTVALREAGGQERLLSAGHIVIATGTRPARPESVEFDGRTILDSDNVLTIERVPRSMVIVGAGVIGMEYACMFAALGSKVTVVERRAGMLDMCDVEVIESLKYHLRDLAVTFRFGESVAAVERHPRGTLTVLEKAGLAADARGRITVDEHYRTQVPHIYAVGDVIGFPALAATSMEQGRAAAYHACGEPVGRTHRLQPIGIYTIPEISFIGRTEDQLTEDRVPFEVGVARYRELARGQIIGDAHGMLKLLVSPEDRTLLGVHCFGSGATELIHIGQSVMGLGGTVDYLVDAVFNYPTLAESYKVAALDATNRLRQLDRIGD
ncbi:NAD(P)(+) transhydrogenase (Si-specific) [Streptomyces bobili]